MDLYNLFIIYSDSNIEDILDALYSYSTNKFQIGPIRKDFTRNKDNHDYIESNRKIIYLKKSLFNILVKEGLSEKTKYDFRINLYDIRKDNYPPEDSMSYLYFPTNIKNVDPVGILTKKLTILSKLEIIGINDWSIKNEGLIIFSDNVSMINRIKIKIILDDKEDYFRISWIKKQIFNKIILSNS